MKKLISTDSIGWLGKPEQFIELYKDYFEDKTFNGVELIAFKPIKKLEKTINVFKQNNIPIISFHSKTGGENRLPTKYGIVMKVVNSFIFGVDTLTKRYKNIEFLSHTPYLENKKVKEIIVNNKPKAVWIENHTYGKKGIKETIELINIYRKLGINVKGMLDLYHLLAYVPVKEMIDSWPKIIEDIESNIKWFSGIHFPIGSRKDDSLPIEQMTDKMLSLFGKKIIPHLERVVIENQQANLGLFYSTKQMLEKQKRRNKINFLRLKRAGIL